MRKLIIIFICLTLFGCGINSRGEKMGIVVKAARHGYFFPTGEVELIRPSAQGMIATGLAPFDCSISEMKVYEKLESLLDKNISVKIRYHTELFVAPWRAETKCFIEEVIE